MNNTIQTLPKEERPYEKCLSLGPASLTESELLAVILRTGTQGTSSIELARKVLEGEKQHEGLTNLYHHSLPDLMTIKGIGKVKAIQILCIAELSKRMATVCAKQKLDFHNPASIADYYMERLRHEEQEQVICMMLNSSSQLLGDVMITKGTVNTSLVSPRDILLTALGYHAVCIILIHNHPSGNPQPSQADILLTKRVYAACQLIDIPLLDHIIIGDQQYISFREMELLTDD